MHHLSNIQSGSYPSNIEQGGALIIALQDFFNLCHRLLFAPTLKPLGCECHHRTPRRAALAVSPASLSIVPPSQPSCSPGWSCRPRHPRAACRYRVAFVWVTIRRWSLPESTGQSPQPARRARAPQLHCAGQRREPIADCLSAVLVISATLFGRGRRAAIWRPPNKRI